MTKPCLKYLVVFGFLAAGIMQHASAAEEPLPPDEAFKLKVSLQGRDTVITEFAPAKNHYLYKDKIRFALKNPNGVSIREVKMPAGEVKNDGVFGRTEVYRQPFQTKIALDRSPKATTITLLASYQGCYEKLGVCYPPMQKSFQLTLP